MRPWKHLTLVKGHFLVWGPAFSVLLPTVISARVTYRNATCIVAVLAMRRVQPERIVIGAGIKRLNSTEDLRRGWGEFSAGR